MKERENVVKKILLLLLCITSIAACKKGDGDSGGFFSFGNDFTPATAEELQENWSVLSEDQLENSKELADFYEARAYNPVWVEKNLVDAFVEELENATTEGLNPDDYFPSDLQNLLDLSQDRAESDRVLMETKLTEAFFSYAHDLYYGKVNPKELYSLWGIKRTPLNLSEVLDPVSSAEGLVEALASLKPQQPVYEGLKKSLAEYREKIKQDSAAIKIAEGESIKPGEKDSRTAQIARRLQQLGYVSLDSLSNDSIYSNSLVNAVKNFQKEKDIEPDGVIGNSTLQKMNMDDADLLKKILVNLERWRWYPRDLGEHYILVNIPDFRLAVVKDGDTVRKHNVIAGSKERQTVVFTDTLEYIVINPLWNIPPTIQKEDIIPKASRNPSYLSNNNISVTSPNGEVLNPGSINWSSDEVKNYRFSQAAGVSNPLGRVKIIYPNEYLIYLHDTPSKALFDRSDRAESSGCVRVENAIDLSAYVVKNQDDWSLEKIKEQIASGKTKHVKITNPIQVHHLYWTAWRGLDKTYFAEDVYNLDEEVYTALTKTP